MVLVEAAEFGLDNISSGEECIAFVIARFVSCTCTLMSMYSVKDGMYDS